MNIIKPAGIWVPRTKIVEVEHKAACIGMKGRYMLRKVNRWGQTIQETPWFDNLILNAGRNRMGTGAAIAGAMIGTGTGTPDVTETALNAQTTYTTTPGTGAGVVSNNSSPYENTRTFVYRTALGALNGNYSEVGVGWASGNCFSRALIVDAGGSPTTIPVASDEQLDIVYQLSVFPPLTDFTDTVTITGVGSVGVTGRAANVNQTSSGGWIAGASSTITLTSSVGGATTYNGAIGAITGSPSSPSGGTGVAQVDTYSSGSYNRTGRYNWATNQGNATTGIRSVFAWWDGVGAAFQYEYGTVIPKNNTQTLVLNYSISWAP
jgi:hypothetical protein